MSNTPENLQHSVPPTPEEAVAFATQAIINTLNRETVAPRPSHFRPEGEEDWDKVAERACAELMPAVRGTARIDEHMPIEEWHLFRKDAERGDAPSRVALTARVLNEATKSDSKLLCLSLARRVLSEMRDLASYQRTNPEWVE